MVLTTIDDHPPVMFVLWYAFLVFNYIWDTVASGEPEPPPAEEEPAA